MSVTSSIVETSTRRPVTVFMFTLALCLFGFVLLGRLGLTLLPDLSYPTLTIRTDYAGAAPSEIENLITKPIEESIGVVKNLREVRSVSKAGQSDVLLEFNWGTDMGLAGLDVREKLDIVRLPLDVPRPSLLRFNPSLAPIVRLSMSRNNTSNSLSDSELIALRRLAEDEIKRRLESIEGVAAVKVSGGLEDEVQVLVDQEKLSQINLSIEQVANRLKAENVNLSGGRLDEGSQQFLVRTINQYQSVDEIANSIITSVDGRKVYLRDIAVVQQNYKEREAITRIDGVEAVEIAIYKEGDANTVSVSETLRKRLEYIEKNLDEEIELKELYNQSDFIQSAIDEVLLNALIGGILAMLVLYLFLRNFKSTLIISLAIPISVIISFNLMYGFNITLNMMSLGGLALAVGLLVDNAIVVLENIAKKKEQGLDDVTAAREGTIEVAGAIFAATLTTIAVFLPLVFVEGIAGQLFSDQALTVTFALIISLLMAITVIPMISAFGARKGFSSIEPNDVVVDKRPLWRKVLTFPFRLLFILIPMFILTIAISFFQTTSRILGFLMKFLVVPFNAFYSGIENIYSRLLPWSLKHKAAVLIIALSAFSSTWLVLQKIGVELIPSLSQGELLVELKAPAGTPLKDTDELMIQANTIIRNISEIERTYSVAGTGNRLDSSPEKGGENRGELNIVIKKPLSEEKEKRVINELRKSLEVLPGIEVKIDKPALFTFKTPLEVEISGYNLAKLKEQNDRLVKLMAENDRFGDVKSTIQQGHPEVQIEFDHEKAAFLGLNVPEVAKQVVSQIRGTVATKYAFRDRKIDVLVRVNEEQRSSVEDIRRLIVNPTSEKPITLEAIADVKVAVGPNEINRISQERVAIISANLNYGDLGEAASVLQSMVDELPSVPGVEVNVAGQNEEMKVSFDSLKIALGLAIFLVYLVMASQFESLLHPFVILFSVPLAMVGAVYALFITGSTISVVVFIGLIMLAGIVVNNAIVLIDKINQLRKAGSAKYAAIVEAGSARLRPIVMTTLTTALGMLPLALGLGEGAEIRAPMAITVIGGLLVSTLLTLVVIPVLYSLFDRKD
ncbi:efflux RND transporter permease subunit [Pleionea litopenaei]|uniref:Efflux RND transporter permease subunit n=1 Tax=Pleionea litopenaei TaxID=3070815 RepID=A0AA51RSR3_9GAMM|nr:efflux RND transporter permease subunit [Pleionea sp. HL-JVS1]WMS86976.1 efflux RND transporter permease subunit [Pleionea sp. HL-JVS1]